jgi:hypothetical protein
VLWKTWSRGRLIDILFHLSNISIKTILPRLSGRVRSESLYTTEADIVFEPGYNSSPQYMHFNHRRNCFELVGQKRLVNLHMHPYLTLKKLTDLLFADHEMPDHLKEVMLGCKNISSGCSICLHKCIKFDGVVQGIPVTHIYCSTSEEQNGTRHGKRFDWV